MNQQEPECKNCGLLKSTCDTTDAVCVSTGHHTYKVHEFPQQQSGWRPKLWDAISAWAFVEHLELTEKAAEREHLKHAKIIDDIVASVEAEAKARGRKSGPDYCAGMGVTEAFDRGRAQGIQEAIDAVPKEATELIPAHAAGYNACRTETLENIKKLMDEHE